MAKVLGNTPYNEIVKNRDNVSRREGVSKDKFEKLVKKINVCGFENNDGNITAYFSTDDLEQFESIINYSDDSIYIKKIEQFTEGLNNLDERLTKLYNLISENQTEKELMNAINNINKRFDSIEEYLSEYCSIISEMLNNKNNSTDSKVSIIEADGCNVKINELMDKFDSLYGDIIRNIAYLRSDLKIQIGKKSIPKRKKTFFILVIIFLVITIGILFKNFLLRWLE